MMKRTILIYVLIFFVSGVALLVWFVGDSPKTLPSEQSRGFEDVKNDFSRIFHEGKFLEADEMLKRPQNTFPNSPDYWNMRGSVSVALKAYPKAREYFQTSIDKGGGLVAKFNLAEVDFLLKDFESSRKLFWEIYRDNDSGNMKDLAFFKFFVLSLELGSLIVADPVEINVPPNVSKITSDYCKIYANIFTNKHQEDYLGAQRRSYVAQGFGAVYEDAISEAAKW